MMKFAIFREFVKEGRSRRNFLAEWDQDKIASVLSEKFKEVHGVKCGNFEYIESDIEKAIDLTIQDFKRESLKIP